LQDTVVTTRFATNRSFVLRDLIPLPSHAYLHYPVKPFQLWETEFIKLICDRSKPARTYEQPVAKQKFPPISCLSSYKAPWCVVKQCLSWLPTRLVQDACTNGKMGGLFVRACLFTMSMLQLASAFALRAQTG
jgi:hypothetical protein